LCDKKTWTEESVHVSPRSVLTRRAGADACRRVGEEARPVSRLARELGVSWSTVMDAVVEHGTPLVEDPARVGPVRQLGLDETWFLKATPRHPTRLVTGLVDLERRVMIDLIEGNTATDVRAWLAGRPDGWLEEVRTVAIDLHESYRAGLSPHLAHARRVADPFHVVGVANRCLDTVRRRVQQETLGHRGRKRDPLYRIRKVLLRGAERLDERGNRRMLFSPAAR
jgi:transposase